MDARLEPYRVVVSFLGEALGPDYEVVLHDLTSEDGTIVAIVNNHISGRTEGAPLSNMALRFIQERMYEKQDEQRSELLNIRNDAEKLIASTEAALAEHKKDWDRVKKKQIKEELNALRRIVGKTTPDKIDVTSAGNIHEAADRLKATLQRYNENI